MDIQSRSWRMGRRTFLRAAGVTLPLPWLEAMGVRSASVTNAGEITPAEIPRRAYFSNWGFFEVAAGIPQDTGLNYTPTPTLAPLAPFKNDCTVISGLRAFSGGHNQQLCLLTGADRLLLARQNLGQLGVELDQLLALLDPLPRRTPDEVSRLGIVNGSFAGEYFNGVEFC